MDKSYTFMHKKIILRRKVFINLKKRKKYLVIFENHSIIGHFDRWLKSQPKSYNPHIIDAVAKSNTRLSSSSFYQ